MKFTNFKTIKQGDNMKKMFFGMLLMAAVFAQGMNFTGFNNYKLSTAPGTGVNPPSGNISIWWTVTDSVLTMHWRDSAGADHTFSSGSGGGLSDAPSDGKQYCRKDAAWTEVVSGSYTVQTLGTSGDQTINRNTSDKWTLTPSGAVNLLTSNFTDMQSAEIDIINGGTNVSFPAAWSWPSSVIPNLQTLGVDKIKITCLTFSSTLKMYAERIMSWKDNYGNDANTQLLLNFNDSSLTDESQNNKIATNNGTTIDTTNKKFGTGSLSCTGMNNITYSWHNNWTFGTGDFTIDFWLKTTQNPSTWAPIFSGASWCPFMLDLVPGGKLKAYVYPSMWQADGTTSVNDGNWHHIAWVRHSSVSKIYIDGQFEMQWSDTADYLSSSSFAIGSTGSCDFEGNVDGFRMRNTATWTTNFTPPAIAYY